MGCRRDCVFILIVFNAWLWQLVHGSQSYDRDSLDSFLYDYAFKKIRRPRSGHLYEVVPPSNFSGMEVAVVRVRTRSLWKKGISHGSLAIPPRILPWPYTKRVDIVYQNLGNWSSLYYSVPNHTFVAPVIGFLAYDSDGGSVEGGAVELKAVGDAPLVVNFTELYGGVSMSMSVRCVRFDSNGTVEFSSMEANTSSCVVSEQGHFSVVVPRDEEEAGEGEGEGEVKRWWIMGIAAGLVGVMWVGVVVVGWRRRGRRKVERMEEEAERSEGLESIWIKGRSRMPFASAIRTQPVLETTYLP